MKCKREYRTNLFFCKSLNSFLFICLFLFLTLAQENLLMIKSIKLTLNKSEKEISNQTHLNNGILIKKETHAICNKTNKEQIKIEVDMPSQNITIIPARITDKVDMDIKKLDIKLEKLSQMIENYEKNGNSSNTKSQIFLKNENYKLEMKKISLNLEELAIKNITETTNLSYRKDNSVKYIIYLMCIFLEFFI